MYRYFRSTGEQLRVSDNLKLEIICHILIHGALKQEDTDILLMSQAER